MSLDTGRMPSALHNLSSESKTAPSDPLMTYMFHLLFSVRKVI